MRLAIRVAGEETRSLQESIAIGDPAAVSRPLGRFHYGHGLERQIWIAAGVGITPFMSWVDSLDAATFRHRVDLLYTVPTLGEALFVQELEAGIARLPTVTLHVVASAESGRLEPGSVVTMTGADPATTSVFMCGPTAMMRQFETGLAQVGFQPRRIVWERFDFR